MFDMMKKTLTTFFFTIVQYFYLQEKSSFLGKFIFLGNF